MVSPNISEHFANSSALKLAQEVRRTRLTQNITQGELARRVGISLGTYHHFEKTGDVSLKKFLEIIRAIGRGSSVRFLSFDTPLSLDELEQTAATKNRQRARKTMNKNNHATA
jgi:transcriptional regulator with XRE-family HTH domain